MNSLSLGIPPVVDLTERELSNCSICFEAVDPAITDGGDDRFPMETRCHHLFHQRCIMQWMRTADRCPNCNTEPMWETTERGDGREIRRIWDQVKVTANELWHVATRLVRIIVKILTLMTFVMVILVGIFTKLVIEEVKSAFAEHPWFQRMERRWIL